MAIGLVIIIIYLMIWVSGYGTIYDFNENFFYNLGVNSILIIGVLSFCKDLKKTLNIRKENKLKAKDSANDKSKNDKSVSWQEYLEKNYKTTGTRTKINDIKTNNNTSEKTIDYKVKLQKQNSFTKIYSILAISVSINILLFASLILVSNNMNQIKDKYNKLEKESSQMCEWHFQLTDDGPIKICN